MPTKDRMSLFLIRTAFSSRWTCCSGSSSPCKSGGYGTQGGKQMKGGNIQKWTITYGWTISSRCGWLARNKPKKLSLLYSYQKRTLLALKTRIPIHYGRDPPIQKKKKLIDYDEVFSPVVRHTSIRDRWNPICWVKIHTHRPAGSFLSNCSIESKAKQKWFMK